VLTSSPRAFVAALLLAADISDGTAALYWLDEHGFGPGGQGRAANLLDAWLERWHGLAIGFR
jgi:hypothetical protein